MRRRDFMAGLLLAAATRPVRAQHPEARRRIGILSPGGTEPSDPSFKSLNAFLQALQELGYTEGQNLTVEREFANGSSDRLRELAAEMVRRKPEIIVALSTTAARPAKQTTGTIPIAPVGRAD